MPHYFVGVYGTLRPGGRLNHVLRDSLHIGTTRVHVPGTALVMVNGADFPALVIHGKRRSREERVQVMFDLYRVEQEVFNLLQMIEGVPTFYHLQHFRTTDEITKSPQLLSGYADLQRDLDRNGGMFVSFCMEPQSECVQNSRIIANGDFLNPEFDEADTRFSYTPPESVPERPPNLVVPAIRRRTALLRERGEENEDDERDEGDGEEMTIDEPAPTERINYATMEARVLERLRANVDRLLTYEVEPTFLRPRPLEDR